KVQVNVPVVFENEEAAPGLKRGGVLNVVRHELELICDAASIPDNIPIDLTGLDVGESIHISHVKLPAGAEPTITDRDFTIATIVAATALSGSEGDTTKDDGEGEGEESSWPAGGAQSCTYGSAWVNRGRPMRSTATMSASWRSTSS